MQQKGPERLQKAQDALAGNAAVAALLQNRAKAAFEGQQEIARLRLIEQHQALEEVCFSTYEKWDRLATRF